MQSYSKSLTRPPRPGPKSMTIRPPGVGRWRWTGRRHVGRRRAATHKCRAEGSRRAPRSSENALDDWPYGSSSCTCASPQLASLRRRPKPRERTQLTGCSRRPDRARSWACAPAVRSKYSSTTITSSKTARGTVPSVGTTGLTIPAGSRSPRPRCGAWLVPSCQHRRPMRTHSIGDLATEIARRRLRREASTGKRRHRRRRGRRRHRRHHRHCRLRLPLTSAGRRALWRRRPPTSLVTLTSWTCSLATGPGRHPRSSRSCPRPRSTRQRARRTTLPSRRKRRRLARRPHPCSEPAPLRKHRRRLAAHYSRRGRGQRWCAPRSSPSGTARRPRVAAAEEPPRPLPPRPPSPPRREASPSLAAQHRGSSACTSVRTIPRSTGSPQRSGSPCHSSSGCTGPRWETTAGSSERRCGRDCQRIWRASRRPCRRASRVSRGTRPRATRATASPTAAAATVQTGMPRRRRVAARGGRRRRRARGTRRDRAWIAPRATRVRRVAGTSTSYGSTCGGAASRSSSRGAPPLLTPPATEHGENGAGRLLERTKIKVQFLSIRRGHKKNLVR